MYCPNCGKQIDDDSSFCRFCANPIGLKQASSEEKWEFCQVLAEVKNGPYTFNCKCKFWAEAVGKDGTYNAGESAVYTVRGSAWRLSNPPTGHGDREKKVSADAHATLVKYLLSQGWEDTGERDFYWWTLRFRRRISK